MSFLAEISIAFTAGLIAAGSPCVLPLYPGYLAYIVSMTQKQENHALRYTLGLSVLAGILTTLIVIGAILALLQLAISDAMSIAIPFAYAVIIAVGILILADINPFMTLSSVNIPWFNNSNLNAYLYGMLYAPIAFPCSGPLLVSLFALSFTVTDLAELTGLFLLFGMGMGTPLILMSLLTDKYQLHIVRMVTRHFRLTEIASGVILILIGVYGFWTNWQFLSLYLQ